MDIADFRIPFLLPLLVVAGGLGYGWWRHRRPTTPPTVLICTACEHSVKRAAGATGAAGVGAAAGAGAAAACPRCGGALEDVRGFYDRHPERRG